MSGRVSRIFKVILDLRAREGGERELEYEYERSLSSAWQEKKIEQDIWKAEGVLRKRKRKKNQVIFNKCKCWNVVQY